MEPEQKTPETTPEPKKKLKALNPMLLLVIVVVLCAVLSYVIPAGTYERVVDPVTEQEVVDPNSFTVIERTPTTPFQLLQSLTLGLQNAAYVIFFLLMISWITHVRKPRSFSTPTMIIMPTRNRMMSSSVPISICFSDIALQATSSATPMNATPTRRSQKSSVVEMTAENTASVSACVAFVASPASSPPNVTPQMMRS